MKKTEKLAGASILSAVAASLCCITPVLALISGASGVASSFSWLEPFRPYLLVITILVLAFAWFQKLKPRTAEELHCNCDEEENPPFLQTKTFLGVITLFAFLMMAFSYYGHIFYPKPDMNQVVTVSSKNIQEVKLNVNGMSCGSCEMSIENEVNKLPGIITVAANKESESTMVKFDNTKTSISEIENTINKLGYAITSKK